MIGNPWWKQVDSSADLAQGELIYHCLGPIVPNDFNPTPEGGTVQLEIQDYDLVIVTQSCDLISGQNKSDMVAACPFRTIDEAIRWEYLEETRKGRREGLYILACPEDHKDLKHSLMVDFRQVFTLPTGYVEQLAQRSTPRYQLQSPYVQHFSQALGRMFMRVALNPELDKFTKTWKD